MCKANGVNAVFQREYLHRGLKKSQREERSRTNVTNLHSNVTNPRKSVISKTVNKSQAVRGYGRFQIYIKQ